LGRAFGWSGPSWALGCSPAVRVLLKAALGLPIQLISGYKGTAAIRLAVESGELAGARFNWISMRSALQFALESGDVVVVLQLGPCEPLTGPRAAD
jgi:hypothetical protein